MLTRLIITVVLVAAIIYLYRKYTATKNSPMPKSKPGQPAMKRCAHCGIYLPETDTIKTDQLHFCSDQHRLEYQKQHSPHE